MQPQMLFLPEAELVDLKNSCIFCNERFDTKEYHSTSEQERGSHYTEHTVTVTHTKYLINVLGIYHFSFAFNEESQKTINEIKEALLERMIKKRKESAESLKRSLEISLDLPEERKQHVINGAVAGYLYDLTKEQTCWGSSREGSVEIAIENLFHHLTLGDLRSLSKINYVPNATKDEHYMKFSPGGLLSHKECWPLTHTAEKQKGDFKYCKLYKAVIKNPRFKTYEEEQYKNYFELLNEASIMYLGLKQTDKVPCISLPEHLKQMQITVEVSPYNPLEHI